jgi:hypothetical protein
MQSRGHPDPIVRKARAKLGNAVAHLDEERAITAVRELIRARRAVRIREDLETLMATGQSEDEVAS